MEKWKDIKGYEGLYQVSDLGRVRSLDRYVRHTQGGPKFQKGGIMKETYNFGYKRVGLYDRNTTRKDFRVHRLVAEAFIPNPHNLPQVNHKSEDKTDNRVCNLEWCDAKYNANYGTRGKRISNAQMKPVLQYTLDGQFIKEWGSIRECKKAGFHHADAVARGLRNKCGGFIWKYKE